MHLRCGLLTSLMGRHVMALSGISVYLCTSGERLFYMHTIFYAQTTGNYCILMGPLESRPLQHSEMQSWMVMNRSDVSAMHI